MICPPAALDLLENDSLLEQQADFGDSGDYSDLRKALPELVNSFGAAASVAGRPQRRRRSRAQGQGALLAGLDRRPVAVRLAEWLHLQPAQAATAGPTVDLLVQWGSRHPAEEPVIQAQLLHFMVDQGQFAHAVQMLAGFLGAQPA
ncbi:hypothetical protein ABPG75_007446 [Micractinium tetrahymenae]